MKEYRYPGREKLKVPAGNERPARKSLISAEDLSRVPEVAQAGRKPTKRAFRALTGEEYRSRFGESAKVEGRSLKATRVCSIGGRNRTISEKIVQKPRRSYNFEKGLVKSGVILSGSQRNRQHLQFVTYCLINRSLRFSILTVLISDLYPGEVSSCAVSASGGSRIRATLVKKWCQFSDGISFFGAQVRKGLVEGRSFCLLTRDL